MVKRKFIDSEKQKLIEELLKKADHEILVIWACECAEHVLSYFEEKYPDDKRPRKAVEAGRFWIGGQISVSQARKAAFKPMQQQEMLMRMIMVQSFQHVQQVMQLQLCMLKVTLWSLPIMQPNQCIMLLKVKILGKML